MEISLTVMPTIIRETEQANHDRVVLSARRLCLLPGTALHDVACVGVVGPTRARDCRS